MKEYIQDLCKDKSLDWLDGFAKGILAFAHWNDGHQYVGTTGTLAQDVMVEIFKIKNKIDDNK